MPEQNLYEMLGVDPSASDAEIQKAYRERAMILHPDKGGDPEQFQSLALAKQILTDPDRRAHYDRTGTDESITDEVRNAIAQLFASALDMEPEPPDLMKAMCETVDRNRSDCKRAVDKATRKLKKLEAKRERFRKVNESTKNTKSREFLLMVVNRRADELDREIKHNERQIKVATEILTFFNDIKFPPDESIRQSSPFGSLGGYYRSASW